jgi:alpha-N-arabinofuranosidase
MIHAEVKVNPGRILGEVDRRIYGQYIENLTPADRPIYGGVCDEAGNLYPEVIDDLRAMQVPALRWGGNYNDVYHWMDGIGPGDQRPIRPNYFWGGYEPNRFGTHEFLDLCERLETMPFININLGSGDLLEALGWLEYCNHAGDTALTRMRARNGRAQPWNVPVWGIGNEAWGKWEACYSTPEVYVERFNLYAQYLRRLDPSIQLVAVGYTQTDWNQVVLQGMDTPAEFLSLHSYGHSYLGQPGNYVQLAALPVAFEQRFEQMSADIRQFCDRPVSIALDEWNVRHFVDGQLNRQSHRQLQDAVFVGGVFHAMQRHCQSVKMANYVCMLNGNAPLIRTETGNLKTPLYHVFRLYQAICQSLSIECQTDSPVYTVAPLDVSDTNLMPGEITTPYVDAAATMNPEKSCVVISLVNRHATQAAAVDLSIRNWGAVRQMRGVEITGTSPEANEARIEDIQLPLGPDGSRLQTTLQPHSVQFVTLLSRLFSPALLHAIRAEK